MFVSADFSTVYDAAFISVKYCAYQCGGTKSVIVITIHTYVHMFSSPFLGLPRWAGTRKVKPIWILLKQRESEWQWHQLGHMQVCTSLQTDNHASTPPLSFVQAGCRSCCPTNSIIALKAPIVILMLVLHTAETVLLLSWTAFILDVNSKPTNCSIRSSTSWNAAYITC